MTDSPSWKDCAEARADCQKAIHAKLDTIIGTLGEINGERRAEARESTAQRPAVVRGLTGRELVLIIGAIGALVTGIIVALASKGGA